jgi:hypothetical protein
MFVSGPYRVSYGGNTVGHTERGVEMEHSPFEEPIIADFMGDSKVDGVYTGADVFMSMVLQEWDILGAKNAFWPYATNFGSSGLVGRLQSDMPTFGGSGSSLVLTVIPGSRAASVGPATITAPLTVTPGGNTMRHLFASRHRKVPIRLQCLPWNLSNQQAGQEQWFITS